MNERIRLLAEQANLEIDPAHPDHNQQVLEKFAELIVRECAEKCVYAVDRQEILAHFGVEE